MYLWSRIATGAAPGTGASIGLCAAPFLLSPRHSRTREKPASNNNNILEEALESGGKHVESPPD
jgi:hypothetical protein